MHVISLRRLRDFWLIHPAAKGPLMKWHAVAENAIWTCFADVRQTYNSTDKVARYLVFDVNSYRIVATVRYPSRVYIYHVFTHSEYDKWQP